MIFSLILLVIIILEILFSPRLERVDKTYLVFYDYGFSRKYFKLFRL